MTRQFNRFRRFFRYSLPLYLVLTTLFVDAQDEDLYNLLGVERDASVKEIRKAFKVLAVKLHPDKNKVDISRFNFFRLH